MICAGTWINALRRVFESLADGGSWIVWDWEVAAVLVGTLGCKIVRSFEAKNIAVGP
ncbi:MAG: hypothetical protein ACYSTF_08875 [Planctomycetota bacterium]|jgi:hypothetical protein